MKRHVNSGFSLMELMATVVIIGILASIAYPMMTGNAYKAYRTSGKTAVMNVASRLEQYYINNKSYTENIKDLGMSFPGLTYYINEGGEPVSAANAYYKIWVSLEPDVCGAAVDYCVMAEPWSEHAKDDEDCSTLTLTSTGVKTPGDCW